MNECKQQDRLHAESDVEINEEQRDCEYELSPDELQSVAGGPTIRNGSL
jgi:hypothetical protein